MKTAEILRTNGRQAVTLPDEFQFEGDTVSIRREGEAVILEPVKPGGRVIERQSAARYRASTHV